MSNPFPERPGRLMLLLLAVHIGVWSWVGVAHRGNLDGPGDMLEAFVWGQAWQWGYYKHPPLMAWLAGGWFSVFPRTDLSFAALAATCSAVSLAGFACLLRQILPPRWVTPTCIAAFLLPAVTVMALRFNANTVVLATWPWVVVFFLRYVFRPHPGHAAMLAVSAALAMHAKYFSAVLLLAMLIGMLLHAPWRVVLLRPLTGAVLVLWLLLMLPHGLWLERNEWAPFTYAAAAAGGGLSDALPRALNFLAAQVVLAVPAMLVLVGALTAASASGSGLQWLRVTVAAFIALLRPGRDPLWWPLIGPAVLTAFATVVIGARTSTVWGLPLQLFALAFLARALAQQQPAAAPRQGVGPELKPVLLLWFAAAGLAPLVWQLRALQGDVSVADPRAELAQQVHALWRQRHGSALPWVAGSEVHAASVAFYGANPDRAAGGIGGELPPARYWSLEHPELRSPWVSMAQLRAEGSAIVCRMDDEPCRRTATLLSERRLTLSVAKLQRGVRFAPRSFEVHWLDPAATPSALHQLATTSPTPSERAQ